MVYDSHISQTLCQLKGTDSGTIGARLHVSFPVLNRSSFGFWISYFSVISRVVLAMFWFSIQVRNFTTQSGGPFNTIHLV